MLGLIRKVLSVLRIRYLEILYLAPKQVASPDGYRAEVLDEEKVRKLSEWGFEYGSKNIRRITDGVAICIAVYFNDELAGLCWYAIKDFLHSQGYMARINSKFICGYGLKILPKFQKKGIRSVLVNRALKWVKENKRDGLIAAIDFDNQQSLRSVTHMGYEKIGYSYFCRWLPLSRSVKFYYYLEAMRPNFVKRSFIFIKKWGFFSWMLSQLYSLINRFGEFRLLHVYLTNSHDEFTGSVQLHERDELRQLVDPDMELSRDWIEYATNSKLSALVCCEREIMSGYYWLAYEPIPTSSKYVASVNPEYCYGFKGYTDPESRGRGVFSLLIRTSAQVAAKKGKKGVISHVELVNYSSKSAHQQANAVLVGYHLIVRLGPFRRIYNSAGARIYGSKLEQRK